MQVNSAQDYTTSVKRSVVAKLYVQDPPSAKNRVSSTYTSVVANKSTQRIRFIVPIAPGLLASTSGLYSSGCCVSSTQSGLVGSLV